MRLTGRPPGIYIALAVVCAFFVAVTVTSLWPIAVAAGVLAITLLLLAVRAGSVRFVLECTPERVLELGSAFGRTRVPLPSIAAVRRRHVSGGRGPSYDVWEVIGADGERLARAGDLGLSREGLRALETELRLLHVLLERG